MGTRTYSRRGVNGQRVLTAAGRRRAGLEAIDILGNPVPQPTTNFVNDWVRPAPASSEEMTKWANEPNLSISERGWRESVNKAVQAQINYEDNTTDETRQEFLTRVGELQSLESSLITLGRKSELQQFRDKAQAAGFMPSVPVPEAGAQGFGKYNMRSLEGLSNDYFLNQSGNPQSMAVDVRQAVTDMGNGSFERGLAETQRRLASIKDITDGLPETTRQINTIRQELLRTGMTTSRIRDVNDLLGQVNNSRAAFNDALRGLTSGRLLLSSGEITFKPLSEVNARSILQSIVQSDNAVRRTDTAEFKRLREGRGVMYERNRSLSEQFDNHLNVRAARVERENALANKDLSTNTALEQIFLNF